ncbi:MAG: helix-turn-helix transcriptional regulator [Acidobacteria bacterium]|nr:helix-turn-helix transcriptional regulator [Acidobacteriota bacterium]
MFKPADSCDVIQIDLARVRRLRAALVGGDAVTGLADTFRALGDPTRVRILDVLSHGELCVCDLAAVLSLSQSAVSHQLRLLRSLRLVRARRDGRMVFYALDDLHVVDLLRQGLKHVGEAPARAAARRPTSRTRSVR